MTVITPVYNGSRYLSELIESVRRQTYSCIEHIIIDDGSTDSGKTVAILQAAKGVRWWSRSNKGQYSTINEGIEAANGDVLLIISADDLLGDEHAIAAGVRLLQESDESTAVFGQTLRIREDGSPFPVQPRQSYPAWILPHYLYIAHCALFIRTRTVRNNGFTFDPSFRYQGDREWILRMHFSGIRFRPLPRVVALYRHHDEQVSGNRLPQRWREEHDRIDTQFGINPRIRPLILAYNAWRSRLLLARYMIDETGFTKAMAGIVQRLTTRGSRGW